MSEKNGQEDSQPHGREIYCRSWKNCAYHRTKLRQQCLVSEITHKESKGVHLQNIYIYVQKITKGIFSILPRHLEKVCLRSFQHKLSSDNRLSLKVCNQIGCLLTLVTLAYGYVPNLLRLQSNQIRLYTDQSNLN